MKLTTNKPKSPPGFVQCRFPYLESFITELKQIPGCRYAVEFGKGTWLIPEEMQGVVGDLGKKFKILPNWTTSSNTITDYSGRLNPELFEYQRDTVSKVLNANGGIISYEMGLGKTAVAIECLRLHGTRDVLVVSTRIISTAVWPGEVYKWWPGAPEITYASYGEDVAEDRVFGAIIFDEAHYIKNPKSARSKKAKELCARFPDALKIALTGTPVANEPKDVWHLLHCIFPGRFGTYWKFVHRYCLVENDGYGQKIHGLNEVYGDELRARLERVCSRITKAEVSHLLPPFTVNYIGFRAEPVINRIRAQIDAAFERHEPNVCVMVYGRDKAHDIVGKLREEGRQVFLVTGVTDPKERVRIIKDAIDTPKSILVATYKSIGTGLDLTQFTTAIFAELYYSPIVMLQALGRFSRLNSKNSSKVVMLCDEADNEAVKVSQIVLRKIKDANHLHRSGVTEKALQDALETEDEGFLTRMSDLELREEW